MSFSKLALEIQLQIWELLLEPRTLELRLEGTQSLLEGSPYRPPEDVSFTPYISLAEHSVPILLGICRESRTFGLNKYKKLVLGGRFKGYICFEMDTVSLSCGIWPTLGYHDYTYATPPITTDQHRDRSFAFPEFARLHHVELFYPRRSKYDTVLEYIDSEKVYGMLKELKELVSVTITCGADVTQDEELEWYTSRLLEVWLDLGQGTVPVVQSRVLPTSGPNLPRCPTGYSSKVVYFCDCDDCGDREMSHFRDRFTWNQEALLEAGTSTKSQLNDAANEEIASIKRQQDLEREIKNVMRNKWQIEWTVRGIEVDIKWLKDELQLVDKKQCYIHQQMERQIEELEKRTHDRTISQREFRARFETLWAEKEKVFDMEELLRCDGVASKGFTLNKIRDLGNRLAELQESRQRKAYLNWRQRTTVQRQQTELQQHEGTLSHTS